MTVKDILVFCLQAFLIQIAFSQCISTTPLAAGLTTPGAWAGRGWGYDGIGYGAPSSWNRGWDYDSVYDWPARGLGIAGPGLDITSTSGGSLVVTSSSGIPPVGISLISDNAYGGILTTAGEVPFVGTTGMEGALPTAGAGVINYGCGNGVTTMVSDVAGIAIAPIIAPVIPGAGFIGCGCGSL